MTTWYNALITEYAQSRAKTRTRIVLCDKTSICRMRVFAFWRAMIITEKQCKRCKRPLPFSEFSASNQRNDGLQSYCRECNRDLARKGLHHREYSLEPGGYKSMLLAQGDCCAICGIASSELTKCLSVDHDHATGEIRALLCNKCNIAIGLIDDSSEIAERMAAYLRKHGGGQGEDQPKEKHVSLRKSQAAITPRKLKAQKSQIFVPPYSNKKLWLAITRLMDDSDTLTAKTIAIATGVSGQGARRCLRMIVKYYPAWSYIPSTRTGQRGPPSKTIGKFP